MAAKKSEVLAQQLLFLPGENETKAAYLCMLETGSCQGGESTSRGTANILWMTVCACFTAKSGKKHCSALFNNKEVDPCFLSFSCGWKGPTGEGSLLYSLAKPLVVKRKVKRSGKLFQNLFL